MMTSCNGFIGNSYFLGSRIVTANREAIVEWYNGPNQYRSAL